MKKSNNYNGIYCDMYEILGEETTKKIYEYYKGQQVTFPMRLYSKDYILKYLSDKYDGTNLKQLSRNLGYTERWVKRLIDKNNIDVKMEEEENVL